MLASNSINVTVLTEQCQWSATAYVVASVESTGSVVELNADITNWCDAGLLSAFTMKPSICTTADLLLGVVTKPKTCSIPCDGALRRKQHRSCRGDGHSFSATAYLLRNRIEIMLRVNRPSVDCVIVDEHKATRWISWVDRTARRCIQSINARIVGSEVAYTEGSMLAGRVCTM